MKISTKSTKRSFVNLFAYLLIFYLDGTFSPISFDLLEIGISLENKSARFEPLRIQLRNVLWSKFRETHDWQFLEPPRKRK